MEVVSVNVGVESRIEDAGHSARSGIIKRPSKSRVWVGALGLTNDVIVHTRVHGGVDQAIYAYRIEDYEWWEGELGRRLEPGLFGENLTLRGLPSPDAIIGSRLQFDEVVLEVTAPRIPCATFAARMKNPAFLKRFMQAERPGMYFRVLKTGHIAAGESFTVVDRDDAQDGSGVSIIEIFRASHRKLEACELHRFLAAPIDERTRTDFEARLGKITG